ncbi:MAG: hypothetical protein ACK4TA_22820 [Saprospiraceae bacterium]
MNNRFEARARQNRTTALILTFLFHVALFGGLYYYNSDTNAKPSTETVNQTEKEAVAKPVANDKRAAHRP